MAMQKTLFKKYLRVSLAIILVSFLLLGVMLIVFMSRYWQDEKRDLLNTNVESIAEFASSKILIGEDSGILQTSELQGVIQMFSSNISASIFITDVHGEVKLRSENGLAFQNNQVPSMIVTSAIKGEYAGTSTLDGMFEHSCYVVGRPILATSQERGPPGSRRCIRRVRCPLSGYLPGRYAAHVYFASIGAFAVSFCVVGLFSYGMVRPLREMAIAARCFGQGDFTAGFRSQARTKSGSWRWPSTIWRHPSLLRKVPVGALLPMYPMS